jgi:hypothetical protein
MSCLRVSRDNQTRSSAGLCESGEDGRLRCTQQAKDPSRGSRKSQLLDWFELRDEA